MNIKEFWQSIPSKGQDIIAAAAIITVGIVLILALAAGTISTFTIGLWPIGIFLSIIDLFFIVLFIMWAST